MGKRLTPRDKNVAQRMYAKGSSIPEVARALHVSYTTAQYLKPGSNRRFETRKEYNAYLLRRRGLESYPEYLDHLAQLRGHATHRDRKEYDAQKQGFRSRVDLLEHQVHSKGYRNRYDREVHLAREQGYKTLYAKKKHLTQSRQARRSNKNFSTLVSRQLELLGESQRWLASQLGVSEQTVSYYVHGKSLPQQRDIPRLFRTLGLDLGKYNTETFAKRRIVA